jgi:hypothetical protein
MDPEILQAIQMIDAKIASLQEARNRLATAFGIPNSAIAPATAFAGVPVSSTPPTLTTQMQTAQPGGRKEQLAQFLYEHGAMPRGEVYSRSGLPEGTVSYCLNDKRFFQQRENGDWDITDFSRRGLERRLGLNRSHANGVSTPAEVH